MIVRNDITADTYCPLPFSTAAYCRLKKDFRVHASDVQLDLSANFIISELSAGQGDHPEPRAERRPR